MKFRTAVLVGVLLLVTGVIGATLWAVSTGIDRNARDTIADDLERSRQVFEQLQEYRTSLYHDEARVAVDEPRLRAAANTQEIDHETILRMSRDEQKALGTDLFLMTDGQATLLSDLSNPDASGYDMSGNALIAETLTKGEGGGIWTADGAAFQVQGHRMDFGTTTVAAVVIGYKLDDRVASTVRRQTGSTVLITLDGKAIASSELEGGKTLTPEAVARLSLLAEPASPGTHDEVVIDDETYFVTSGRFPGYHGDAQLRYFVLRSLDRALAVRRNLLRSLSFVAAGALLLTLLLAFVLARRLARPIDALVGFTRKVGAGDLDARASRGGLRETDVLAASMNVMVEELQRSRSQVAQKERLEKEMEIAKKIQTSILPQSLEAPGLQVSAAMIPASEVGGDYYDLLPFETGCWIGIGDVAGHGLTAGLVMLMVQSIVAALTRDRPDTTPRDVVNVLNHVLYENIRHRLENDEHVTFSLMRFTHDGKIVFAGAHEDIVVLRASGEVERITTPGTWLGAIADIERFTFNTEAKLEPGDVMLLYTDGITEATDVHGELFGLDRVCEVLEKHPKDAKVEEIRDDLLDKVARWTHVQQDDVTMLVIRYLGDRGTVG
jgi:sigma-B regulation protein RsbU (phosphoserine phosphatase)